MTIVILAVAVVILLCILAEKFSDKFGMPALMLFMFIGILFGSDGVVGIPFENFKMAENICSVALVFIMFYGGFNTKWDVAKSVAGKAIALSTLGVLITAGITTLLCRFVLGLSFAESFLIGSVLSSTDAASVFAILRKKKLNLKDGTASILEVESGSNDPVSYLLTIIAIGIITDGNSGNIFLMIVMQIVFGIAAGIVMAKVSTHIMIRTRLISEGLDMVFVIAVVLVCYGGTAFIGGNAYLSVYIFGILMGNSHIKNKHQLIPFFDGVTSLAQILIFFLIGLLTFPSQMPAIMAEAVAVVIFITLVARPAAVFLMMLPMHCSVNQCLVITWAGLRGAASSVFAIMAVAAGVPMKQDLFHIVFMVSLFSVAIQGTLLPTVANKLQMVDEDADVRKTFNDYQEETSLQLMRIQIPEDHEWVNKKIKEINIPTGSLALMLKRGDQTIVTRGDTKVQAGDSLILSVPPYNTNETEALLERVISKKDAWCNKAIRDLNLPKNELIAMVIRGDETVIPEGKTIILENDILVMYQEQG